MWGDEGQIGYFPVGTPQYTKGAKNYRGDKMNKFQKEVVKFTKTDLNTVFPFGVKGIEISFYQARKLRKKLLKDLYKRKRD